MAKRPSKPTIKPAPEHRIVVLKGKELFLRTEHTSALKRDLEKVHGEVELVRYDGESDQAADVLDECRSFGLMTAHKLVVVDAADKLVNADTRPLFERYAESPNEGATLVLRADTWRPSNFDKAVDAVGAIVACDSVSPDQAARWAVRRCKQHHDADLEPDAAAHLVDRLGTDLARIDVELAKLAARVRDEGGPVTTSVVTELVGRTREQDMWSLQGEVLTGNPARAITRVREILGASPRDAAVPVLFSAADLARKVHAAAVGIENGQSPALVAKDLRLWGDAKDGILRAARAAGTQGAADALLLAVEADAAQKSGASGSASRRLDLLALRLTRLYTPRR